MRLLGSLYLLTILMLWACGTKYPLDEAFYTTNGDKIVLAEKIRGVEATVLAYISPECPLCVNYGPTLQTLIADFQKRDIQMIGVVSGTYYAPSEIDDYLNAYELEMPVIIDSSFVLSRKYNAKFTPEVHLLDNEGALLYSGAIDNWAISLGRKRLRPTAHYLKDAAINHLARRVIDPKKTTAVGCFIE